MNYLDKDIKALMLDDDVFWKRIETTTSLLKPIAKAITKIEGDTPMPSIVPEIFAELAQVFATNVPKTPATKSEEEQMKVKLLDRKKFCLHNFHLAANILDPRFQGEKLSDDELVDGMEMINQIAEHLEDVEESNVLADYAQYRAKEGLWAKDFVWKFADKVSATAWWNGICGSSALSKVASAIHSMATTSAATERSFSTYANIHTKKRNRLTTERAGKLVYIAHNLKLMLPKKTKLPVQQDALSVLDNQDSAEIVDLEQPSTSCATVTKRMKRKSTVPSSGSSASQKARLKDKDVLSKSDETGSDLDSNEDVTDDELVIVHDLSDNNLLSESDDLINPDSPGLLDDE